MIVLGKASDGRVQTEFEGLANLVMGLRVIPLHCSGFQVNDVSFSP